MHNTHTFDFTEKNCYIMNHYAHWSDVNGHLLWSVKEKWRHMQLALSRRWVSVLSQSMLPDKWTAYILQWNILKYQRHKGTRAVLNCTSATEEQPPSPRENGFNILFEVQKLKPKKGQVTDGAAPVLHQTWLTQHSMLTLLAWQASQLCSGWSPHKMFCKPETMCKH